MAKYIVARVRTVKTIEFIEIEAADGHAAVSQASASGKIIKVASIGTSLQVPYPGVVAKSRTKNFNNAFMKMVMENQH